MSSATFDEGRHQVRDHLERLVRASQASRGAMRAPDIDLTSPASRNLTDDPAVGSTNFPDPVASTLGHVERLLVAADDQMLCVADLVDKPDPTWFGHLAVIRSSIEALSRLWFLTDPDVTALERSRRFANERLSELQHADSLLANQLADLPEELKKQWKDHIREQRTRLSAWASERGIPNPGGSLGGARPRPLDLVVSIYSGRDEASGGKLLGAWQYSTLSSVAHGLPDGMSQYVQLAEPGEHAHLVMTIEDVAGSLEPVLTVHEATVRRLAQFFRWPMSDDLKGELIAARLFVNRAAGHVR